MEINRNSAIAERSPSTLPNERPDLASRDSRRDAPHEELNREETASEQLSTETTGLALPLQRETIMLNPILHQVCSEAMPSVPAVEATYPCLQALPA